MSTDVSPALSGKPLDAPVHPALSLPNRASRWLALLLALACGLLGLGLATHYPLLPPLAIALYLAALMASFRWWQAAPLLLIGLVPVLGLATWTGWFIFEELDLLVMAAAAGGYAAYALGRADSKTSAWRRPLAPSALAKLLLMLFAASMLLSVWRGLQDAGGFEFGWWQGYMEPLNSLRQAKGLTYALLLLPLWQRASASRPDRVERGMLFAMCLALAGMSLAALWERVAFPGLLNFSADYRSTAMFWEMQVGGAMLDGALLLCLPFALAALIRQRSPARLALLLVLVLMASYAALVTFSRGVYLALPVMLVTLLFLSYRQHRARQASLAEQPQHLEAALRVVPLLALVGLFGFSAAQLFDVAGYRALLALTGTALLLLFAPRQLLIDGLGARSLVMAMAALLGLLASALSWSVALLIPKSAYAICAGVVLFGALLQWRVLQGLEATLRAILIGAVWFWSLGCVAVVAGSWGGEPALRATLWPLALWALAWIWLVGIAPPAARFLLGLHMRLRGLGMGALLLALALAVSVGGGKDLDSRVSTGLQDLGARVDHWRSSYRLLQGDAERWLGRGSGRYVAARFYGDAQGERIGDFRVGKDEGGHSLLRLSGGRHVMSDGDLLRLSQRVALPVGEMVLQARVRAAANAGLQFELAEKHLLQAHSRSLIRIAIEGRPGQWQALRVVLPALGREAGGAWWAPRLLSFTVAETISGAEVDIAELRLTDASGRVLLANGDFAQGLSHWYFTSDRLHLPWHAKSLALHLVFEQGWLGLALWGALLAAALWRCSLGRARSHPLAPAIAASLAGFLMVGLFDSLLDAPRVAFLFYCILLLGLCLRSLMPGVASDSRH